ncbi:MAG: hypothetical protein Q4C70_05475 [Planctomycetia bacterium]|nr:hypothetical protein [Planctomycetia bacterium]
MMTYNNLSTEYLLGGLAKFAQRNKIAGPVALTKLMDTATDARKTVSKAVKKTPKSKSPPVPNSHPVSAPDPQVSAQKVIQNNTPSTNKVDQLVDSSTQTGNTVPNTYQNTQVPQPQIDDDWIPAFAPEPEQEWIPAFADGMDPRFIQDPYLVTTSSVHKPSTDNPTIGNMNFTGDVQSAVSNTTPEAQMQSLRAILDPTTTNTTTLTPRSTEQLKMLGEVYTPTPKAKPATPWTKPFQYAPEDTKLNWQQVLAGEKLQEAFLRGDSSFSNDDLLNLARYIHHRNNGSWLYNRELNFKAHPYRTIGRGIGAATTAEGVADIFGYGPIYNTYKWMTSGGDGEQQNNNYQQPIPDPGW